MGRNISKHTKEELLTALRQRYSDSSKEGKGRILNEFVAVSGYHRKHAVRLLSGKDRGQTFSETDGRSRRIYDEGVKEALIVIWEAADRICGKRLKAILPDMVGAMERHGHLHLDPDVRKLVLVISAASIDRLLVPIRSRTGTRRKKRRKSKARTQVPVRTFADWNEPDPGWLEIDLVAHCGGCMAGSFVHTLVVTDISSGWTECLPLLAREQSLVVEGLEILFRQIPFPVLGIDSDNDGAFINDTLLAFCKTRHLEFTRCRAYQKNDQAWVEQKNGAVVRRLVGHDRYAGIVAGQTLAHLYQAARLYVNYFQPSFKLREKVREGAKVKRTYHRPKTPCARLIAHAVVDDEIKKELRSQRDSLDPVELLHRIREAQSALAALASGSSPTEGPGRDTLDQFLAQLPRLWRSGEARPTHRTQPARPRYWRTRKDPFETVWLDILAWLQHDPEATAKDLFERLQREHPGRFAHGQLRTLQRRVREWRRIMARKLVYACIDMEDEMTEAQAVGPSGLAQE